MARPPARELTERELEVMHAFWAAQSVAAQSAAGELTVAEVRDALEQSGRELAYTTVATLVRILTEKGFLAQTNAERPFRYQALRSFEDVSGSLVGDLIERVFGGSRELLLKQLVGGPKLSARERKILQDILRERT
jgi:predicted transcriptional regulator